MSYVTMSDLKRMAAEDTCSGESDWGMGQAMIATDSGGGGMIATQARQATQYQMPGSHSAGGFFSPPSMSFPAPSIPTTIERIPSGPPPVTPPPTITTGGGGGGKTGGGWGGGGFSWGGGRTIRGGGGGYDVYRSSWSRTTTEVTPGYSFGGGGTFIIDNMTAGNAVDDGSEEPGATAASSDQGGTAPAQPAADGSTPQGPFGAYLIEDDPTLTDDPSAAATTAPAQPMVQAPDWLLPSGEPRNGASRRSGCPWKLFVGALAVGAFAGLAGCAIAGRRSA